jgi:CPA2 family monovalent cation:H+ antiporter-2
VVSFLVEIAVMITLAFLWAWLAGKVHQSALLGYILVGIFIGPFMNIPVPWSDVHYRGLVSDPTFIQNTSKLGLMFLLFFTGLGFRASALKSTWKPAVLLAFSDVLLNLYIGFFIGAIFGWPIQDTIFLAAIIGMSSVAVAAKSAEEEKRLARKEASYLFSTMIVEDFISIILLTLASAFVLGNILSTEQLVSMGVGVVILYAFFFIMALFVAPKAFHYFDKIEGNELFVLFSISIVFMSAAFADSLGLPPAIGAFLVGMVFAETSLKDKLEKQMASLKDFFVAIFFISFGMLVDPSVLTRVWPMVAIAVPMAVFNEVLLLGAITYLVGFTSRASINISTGFTGRGEDAVMFASVGSSLKHPDTGAFVLAKASDISPFTGAFCFFMSGLTPALMRYSNRIADSVGRILPEFMKFGGALVARNIKTFVMSTGFHPTIKDKHLIVLIIAYGITVCITLMTAGIYHFIAAAVGIGLLLATWYGISAFMQHHTSSLDLQDLDIARIDIGAIDRYVATVLGLFLAMILMPALFWAYIWQLGMLLNLALLLMIFGCMKWVHNRLKPSPGAAARERIASAGKPRAPPPVEPLDFGPRRPKLRVAIPVRAPKPNKVYKPVPKDRLLPQRPHLKKK